MDSQYTESHTPGELHEMYTVHEVPGLFYWPNCISEEQEKSVMNTIHSDEQEWKKVGSGAKSRRAFHSGYDYDYKSGKVTPTVPIPDELANLADQARECITALVDESANVPQFNQCLVNEYMASHGQGISWHTDHRAFGPFIACFTLNSGADMQFRHPEYSGHTVTVRTEPRSLYIMSGEARDVWQHSMPARKSDTDPVNGKKIPRGDRYSVTFRSVPKK